MKTSESIKNIAAALLKFDDLVTTITKSATNPFFHNKYAPLPDILSAIKEPLSRAGLTVKQFPESDYELTTLIIHPESGEWISSTYKMEPAKKDPQGEGSRITYQRRYALGACLGLNIDIDDDGNEASKQPERKAEEPKDKRPWIKEKAFQQAIDRIASNDPGPNFKNMDEFVAHLYETFQVSKTCQAKITEALNFIKV
jgi:hypothetical protein